MFFKNKILFIFLLFIVGCVSQHYVANEVNNHTIEVNNTIETNEEYLSIINPYSDSLNKMMNQVLNYSEIEMTTSVPQGLLGNFIADLCYEYINDKNYISDLCLLNNGGLRVPIPKGSVTLRKIFELMPFENEMVIVTLSPKKTKELIDYVEKSNKPSNKSNRKAGTPISNVKFHFKNNNSLFINGEEYNSEKNYKVLTSDYLASGGDNMIFFRNPIRIEKTNIKLRDVIVEYISEKQKEGKKLNSKIDERIRYE